MLSQRRLRISRRSGRPSVLLQRRIIRRYMTVSVLHAINSLVVSVSSILSTRTASMQTSIRRSLSASRPRLLRQALIGRRLQSSSLSFRSSGRRLEQFLARSLSSFGSVSVLHVMSSSQKGTKMQSQRMIFTAISRQSSVS